MKRLLGVCLLNAIALLLPGLAAAEPTSLDDVRAKFVERFPHVKPENVTAGPIEGILIVRQGTMVVYLSEDGRYLFQGDLIDLDTNVNLTDKEASFARKDIMDGVDEKTMIVFGPDEPQHSVAIFTDIDCGFCRKLHSEIDQYVAEGIEVRYMLYPRGGPGSPSWKKAEEVACAADRNEAITLAKNDKPVVAKACPAAATVAEHYRLGQEVGLRGTPAMVLGDGELVSGYLPANELARRLASLAK